MKVGLALIGMVAGLVLPLAAANARAVLDPGLNQAGAGADLERGAAPTAENFGRNEGDGNQGTGNGCDCGDHGDHGKKCDKSPSKPYKS
jgi:hypothetical protein